MDDIGDEASVAALLLDSEQELVQNTVETLTVHRRFPSLGIVFAIESSYHSIYYSLQIKWTLAPVQLASIAVPGAQATQLQPRPRCYGVPEGFPSLNTEGSYS